MLGVEVQAGEAQHVFRPVWGAQALELPLEASDLWSSLFKLHAFMAGADER